MFELSPYLANGFLAYMSRHIVNKNKLERYVKCLLFGLEVVAVLGILRV